MIDSRLCRTIGSLLVLAVTGIAVSACTQSDGADYCVDHRLVHGDHAESVARLLVDFGSDGRVTRELRLPAGFPDTGVDGDLFDLQADSACTTPAPMIVRNGSGTVVTSESECGAGNAYRELDVSVFDRLPDLDELEVLVSTPVTSKRFAISRSCARPIFRLN